MVDLDKTEKEIVRLLQRDGRMSFVDMAKEIGVTEGTIRRKFNRLIGEGIIHIAAVADPFKVGFETLAQFNIAVDPAHLEDVLARVSALSRIRYVAVATGRYDVVAEGCFVSNRELSDFLFNELSKIEGIRDIATSLLLRVEKQSFTWGVADDRLVPTVTQAAGQG